MQSIVIPKSVSAPSKTMRTRNDASLYRPVKHSLSAAMAALALFAGLCNAPRPASGQDAGGSTGGSQMQRPAGGSGGLGLELNNAVDETGLCRLSYVAVNGTGEPLEKVSYDVVVFDGEGRVSSFLVLQFGQLPEGKTKVVQFDLADQPCSGISRILVNDVSECETAAGSATICMDALQPTSRTTIKFDT
ncbi:hypothetical protein [Jiella mangrovi]|uniref:Tat pathway signal protein n=1 Tax=Jiella mangrovi TaxID=2821407 RepID=A0ABS4BIZ7_9HYPH|nr:hypothetical protein [Jiella mangrovi]MBP0616740.1 hypothetical protein [Jiella mangrovi]